MRARQQRNFIATLLLSQGVPMLLHGDEMGRSQEGNNNTYAQDSELSWIRWEQADLPLFEFTRAVARLRAEHPTFRRRLFFDGQVAERGEDGALPDVVWLSTDGSPMESTDWNTEYVRSMCMFLNGDAIRGRGERGESISDASFIIYFNASENVLPTTLPASETREHWEVVLDTSDANRPGATLRQGDALSLQARSMVVLREHAGPNRQPEHSAAASVASMTESIPVVAPRQPEPGPAEG